LKKFLKIFLLFSTHLVSLLFVSSNQLFAQTKAATINWYQIEDAVNKATTEPRKLFIYIFSDNCGWCRKMNDVSFSDTVIINYLNDNFYPVKLNASMKDNVILGSRTYKFVPADPTNNNPSYHELVVTLLNGRLAYPAIAFINEKMEYMGVEFGFKNPSLLEGWLYYIAGNGFLTTPDFTEFQKTFQGKL